MKTYTKDELAEILNKHKLWLQNDPAGSRADLSGSNLRGSDLSGSNLSHSNLRGSALRGSDLSYSNLRGSDLSYSNLRGSDLSGSDLSGSDLSYSDLSGSNLRGSDLRGSDLSYSDLSGSDLSGSIFAYAMVSFTGHGECGRLLMAIRRKEGDAPELHCGCFSGNTKALREYIANGPERYKATRTLALDTVLVLLDVRNPE